MLKDIYSKVIEKFEEKQDLKYKLIGEAIEAVCESNEQFMN